MKQINLNNFKVITDNLNTYFKNNKIMIGSSVPTGGSYSKGDIIVNNGANADKEPMWVCTESGNPGKWEAVGAGGTDLVHLKNNVIVNNAVSEVSIGIDGFNPEGDVLTVYRNSVYMIEGVDYNVQGNKIVSLKGNWNAENQSDYKFTFEVLKAVDKVNPNAVVGMENLKDDVRNAIEAAGNIDLSGYQGKTDNSLATTNKTIVGAINELFQSANNGKQLIASAIGEPLSSNDTFSAMSSDINGLLNTFKTNMMNNGVTVSGSDKFKSLIDKIATMVEEGSGKGVQIASGESTSIVHARDTFTYVSGYSESRPYVDITDLGFIPSAVIYISKSNTSHFGTLQDIKKRTSMELPEILFVDNTPTSNSNVRAYVFLANDTVFRSDGTIRLPIVVESATDFMWMAIGVGEEDTTLRDSLASILQEEGVTVTEEDDMASLIGKVDEEFDRKNGFLLGTLNIISATELPSTGIENQICVITDNPVDEFIVSQFTEDMTDVGDAICLDLATNERSDNRLVMVDNGRVKLYYYINRVVQSGNAKETYVYKNNQWVLLVEGLVYLLLDGVDMNNATFGDIYIYKCTYTKIDASTGEICLGTTVQSTYQNKASCFSFANKINIDDYTKLTLRIKVSNIKREPNIVVGLASKAISGTSSTDSGYNNWSNTGASFTKYCDDEVYTKIGSSYPENEYFTLEVDISEMTGTGYLCIGIEDNISSSNWVRINTIGIQ